VDDPGIRCAEITGDVAAIFLNSTIHFDNFKVTDLVVCSNEMLAKIFSNTWI